MTWTYFFYAYVLVPLLVIGYLALGVWLAYRIASKATRPLGRLSLAIVTGLLFLVVPSADAVFGRFQFASLCEKDAGRKVFRTAALDTKYLASDGSPKKELVVGSASYKIGEQYVMTSSTEDVFSWPRITKVRTEIRDIDGNEKLGEVIDFQYWGGWLVHQMPFHVSAARCPGLDRSVGLERLVFHAPAK